MLTDRKRSCWSARRNTKSVFASTGSDTLEDVHVQASSERSEREREGKGQDWEDDDSDSDSDANATAPSGSVYLGFCLRSAGGGLWARKEVREGFVGGAPSLLSTPGRSATRSASPRAALGGSKHAARDPSVRRLQVREDAFQQFSI